MSFYFSGVAGAARAILSGRYSGMAAMPPSLARRTTYGHKLITFLSGAICENDLALLLFRRQAALAKKSGELARRTHWARMTGREDTEA